MTSRAVMQRVAALRGDDAGFTLLEVVVSFTLFVIVAGGAMYGIVNALQASHTSQQRVDAANVAQSFIAAAQADAEKTSKEAGRQVLSTVGGGSAAEEQFTVVRWISFRNPDATQCSPGNTFTVNVVVSQAQTGKYLARSDSVIACPPA
jgi:type II secretory pathway pseudopilin PulG